MTHRGKIARLPPELRHQLNERLENCEKSGTLLAWLNGLPEVQTLLAREFGAGPINRENLSAWRRGGFAEWLDEQQVTRAARQLHETALQLGPLTDEATLSKGLSEVLAVEMARTVQLLLRQPASEQDRWQRLKGIAKQVSALRRGDHRAGWLQLAMQRDRRRRARANPDSVAGESPPDAIP
jgi:hypothetical protein